jgi:hypothetical protein
MSMGPDSRALTTNSSGWVNQGKDRHQNVPPPGETDFSQMIVFVRVSRLNQVAAMMGIEAGGEK